MSQTTPKAAIAEVLNSLDVANDTLWTDDGSPLVEEVQRLANDATITRAQINEAIPGFCRVMAEPAEKNTKIETEQPKIEAAFDPKQEPEVNGSGEQLSELEVRAILERRIRDAETALTTARRVTSESRQEELRCEQRLTRAHIDHQRKYPPITAAQNIQDHLRSQQDQLYERVTGQSAAGRAQIDITMERRNSRGWSRPTRPVNNAA